jgi:hypothetical protein
MMNEEIKVNDGKGLFDSNGLIDTLIVDCNELPKKLACGEYVSFCGLIVEMVQKLALLKKGITKDRESLQDQVKELIRLRDELLIRINGGGEEDGRQTADTE